MRILILHATFWEDHIRVFAIYAVSMMYYLGISSIACLILLTQGQFPLFWLWHMEIALLFKLNWYWITSTYLISSDLLLLLLLLLLLYYYNYVLFSFWKCLFDPYQVPPRNLRYVKVVKSSLKFIVYIWY